MNNCVIGLFLNYTHGYAQDYALVFCKAQENYINYIKCFIVIYRIN